MNDFWIDRTGFVLTSNDWETVRRCQLFVSIEPNELAKLVDANSIVRLTRHQGLFSQGDPADAFFLIVNGQIKLTRLAPDGEEAIVQIFGAGEVFAEAAMFMGGRYPVSATATSDTRLISISSERLHRQVSARPEIAFLMLASMAKHLKSLVAQLEQMKLMTTKQRTIRFLLDQCGTAQGYAEFTLPYDKSIIANTLGMRPETLSRILAHLAIHGVQVSGTSVTVNNVKVLEGLLWAE